MNKNKGYEQAASQTPETDSSLTEERAEEKHSKRKGLILICCGFLIAAVLVTFFTLMMPKKGYYTKDSSVWYYEKRVWFEYDGESDNWLKVSSPGFFRNFDHSDSPPAGIPEVTGSIAYRSAEDAWEDAETEEKKETEGTLVDFVADTFKNPSGK